MQARLIALDWGTTSLRAYLLGERGAILESLALPCGLMAIPGRDFAAALDAATGAWRARHGRLPMIASGMIGSAQGWREIPYVDCPAAAADFVVAIRAQAGCALPIVPGAFLPGAFPDVMRGEETQILGALERRPALRRASLLVLPGTHSKWVTIRDAAIIEFTTYLTGELFAVLGAHSILGRPARDAPARDPASPEAHDAFARGVRAVRDTPARGLSALLFSARTLVLSHRLAPAFSLDYLSGLLVGEELRSALSDHPDIDGESMALIGDAALCERYLRALALFGIHQPPVIPGAAAAGLWQIAEAASLVPAA